MDEKGITLVGPVIEAVLDVTPNRWGLEANTDEALAAVVCAAARASHLVYEVQVKWERERGVRVVVLLPKNGEIVDGEAWADAVEELARRIRTKVTRAFAKVLGRQTYEFHGELFLCDALDEEIG